MAGSPVKCYIYDMSKGMARSLSLGILGKQIDGIWHTGIVVYGREFFFGGGSIGTCPPGGTILGRPDEEEDLGTTEVPEDVFLDYLRELAVTSYRADQYHVLDHNCNTFSDEVATFLTGRGIPSHITSLPSEFLQTPFGQMVKPIIESMSINPGGQARPVFNDLQLDGSAPPSHRIAATGRAQACADPPKARSPKAEVPKLAAASYTADIASFILCKDRIKLVVDSESFGLLEEVQEYLTKVDCSWALGRPHVQVIDKILHDSSVEEALRIAIANLLQNLFLKDDIVTQFKMDPQSKVILNKLVQATKYYAPTMQEVTLQTLCNITRDASFRASLGEENTHSGSPLQRLCDVCIACVLSEPATAVNKYAASLVYNVTLCKINEEQAVGLGSAVIQFLTTSDDTEAAKYCLNGLLNCMNRNAEVVAFAAVMGLDIEGIAMDEPSLTNVKSRIKQKLLTAQ